MDHTLAGYTLSNRLAWFENGVTEAPIIIKVNKNNNYSYAYKHHSNLNQNERIADCQFDFSTAAPSPTRALFVTKNTLTFLVFRYDINQF